MCIHLLTELIDKAAVDGSYSYNEYGGKLSTGIEWEIPENREAKYIL